MLLTMPKTQKICETCSAPHNNRKVNECNDCRTDLCKKCNHVRNPKYKTCYFCERVFELNENIIPKSKK